MANPIRILDARPGVEEGVRIVNNCLRTLEHYPSGTMKTYEDTDFTSGDSPQTHDFYSDTGREAIGGYVINDGNGNIQVDYSQDGITFSDKATIKPYETFNLRRLGVRKIRITHTGTDSAYRVVLI